MAKSKKNIGDIIAQEFKVQNNNEENDQIDEITQSMDNALKAKSDKNEQNNNLVKDADINQEDNISHNMSNQQNSNDVHDAQSTEDIYHDDNILNSENVKHGKNTHSVHIEHVSNTTNIDNNDQDTEVILQTKKMYNTQNEHIETRRFTLIIPIKIYKKIKTIASIKQISVIKTILLAVEKFITENKELIERYNKVMNIQN